MQADGHRRSALPRSANGGGHRPAKNARLKSAAQSSGGPHAGCQLRSAPSGAPQTELASIMQAVRLLGRPSFRAAAVGALCSPQNRRANRGKNAASRSRPFRRAGELRAAEPLPLGSAALRRPPPRRQFEHFAPPLGKTKTKATATPQSKSDTTKKPWCPICKRPSSPRAAKLSRERAEPEKSIPCARVRGDGFFRPVR